jgi:hypothetical protein
LYLGTTEHGQVEISPIRDHADRLGELQQPVALGHG